MSISGFLIVSALLLFVSVIMSKTSSRIGIPALVIFVLIGMLAGSDGLLGFYFDDYHTAKFIGIIAMNFILFSGGMDTKIKDIKPVLKVGLSLSTLGVLITAVLIGFFIHIISDRFSLMEGLLLGAIVSSTDAAATFSIFRTQNSSLKKNLRPTIELESGSNDPMALFLTIGVIFLIKHPDKSAISLLVLFLKDMALGGFVGFIMGKLIVIVMKRINLKTAGLYPILMIAFMFFTYSCSDIIGGNGILSLYVAGIIVGNSNFARRNYVIQSFDVLTWFMQIVMFIVLGLLVFPSRIPQIFWIGIAVTIFLMFIARPIAVFISTSFFRKMDIKEKIFLSWGGLRGATPIIFATYPLVEHIKNADNIFHIVFFISMTSVLLQGSSLIWVAKKLGLAIPDNTTHKINIDLSEGNNAVAEEVDICTTSHVIGKTISEINIPQHILIVQIERRGELFIPKGSTRIERNDRLYIMSESNKDTDNFVNYINQNHNSNH